MFRAIDLFDSQETGKFGAGINVGGRVGEIDDWLTSSILLDRSVRIEQDGCEGVFVASDEFAIFCRNDIWLDIVSTSRDPFFVGCESMFWTQTSRTTVSDD